jgi:trehalose 6-phosphate phosphatase
MQYIFDTWKTIANKIRAASHTLLMFDFDGTLTPIVDTPEMAELSEESRKLLKSLARCPNSTIAIISGRAINDLQSKIEIPGIIYAGNHGLEIQGPDLAFVHPITEEVGPVLRMIALVLKKALGAIRGAIVEDKGLTLSVHYRLVDDQEVDEVKDILDSTVGVAAVLGKVRTTSGKMVHEVRPAVPWDKGKAVKLLMKRYGKGGRQSGLLPLYVGDDLTDEDAFKVIESYGGIAVYVGGENHQSSASYYLKFTEEVDNLIKELLRLN